MCSVYKEWDPCGDELFREVLKLMVSTVNDDPDEDGDGENVHHDDDDDDQDDDNVRMMKVRLEAFIEFVSRPTRKLET